AQSTDTGVFRAIQDLAPDKPPETPAPQVVQLVDAPGAEVDRELLEIFLEEAGEVVATIGSSLVTARDAPHDREALTTIRRGFHTLKGSGRMVGLNDLGEMAWQCEQVMNKWLKDEKPASAALLAFIDLAQEDFARWVDELKASGSAAIDGAEITRQAEMLKAGQEPEAAAPVAAAAKAPAPQSELVVEETPTPVVEEAPAPHAAAAAQEPQPMEPAPAAEPAGFTFESLDLTAPAQPEPPVAAPQPAEAAASADSLDFGDLMPQETPSAAAEAEADVTIGSAVIPRALFTIYIGEAEEHAAALDREMAKIEAEPMHPVGLEFMRAAHTLASSSRTAG